MSSSSMNPCLKDIENRLVLMRFDISNALAKILYLSSVSSSVNSHSDRFRTLTNLKSTVRRLTIYKGEVFRLPSVCREIHVLSGVAWITVAGEDIILTSEKKASLASKKDSAIISALGNMPLLLKVL